MKRRTRVLHICTGNLYGGVETFLVTLARFRDLSPDMEPEFTVCFEGRLSRELRSAGVRVHNVGAVRVRNPFSVWKARAQMRELLSSNRFDVAICHSAWTQAIFGPVLKEKRLRLISWLHGVPSTRHWLETWARRTEPDFMICNSRFTEGYLPKGTSCPRREVLYCPVPSPDENVDAAARSEIRKELETPEDVVVIVQASRMERWKGHQPHIEALAQMTEASDWMCWIVGGPQRPKEVAYFAELQRIVRQSGLSERVRFLGQRSNTHQVLRAADIFCQPNSEPEPFGIVFIEALLAGLPVVTTSIGGGLEIVESNCGVLLPPGDSRALAKALRTLIGDAGLRARMGASGPTRATGLCAPERQIERLADIVREVAEHRSAA